MSCFIYVKWRGKIAKTQGLKRDWLEKNFFNKLQCFEALGIWNLKTIHCIISSAAEKTNLHISPCCHF